MACCGQKREAIRRSALQIADAQPEAIAPSRPATAAAHPRAVEAQPTIAVPAPPKPQFAQSVPRRRVPVEYLAHSRILVNGPVTGTAYEFSAGQRIQAVDDRDAELLLKTAFFRLHRPASS